MANYVGTSGWAYPDWRNRFYPPGLAQRQVLRFMSRRFNSLEVNGRFYGLLRPPTFARWYEETPPGFVFAVKGSRFISQNKRLRDVKVPLANFLASGLLQLEEKLGPIIWQLPRTARFDPGRLSDFLELLPRDTIGSSRCIEISSLLCRARRWSCCDARTACPRSHCSLPPRKVFTARHHAVQQRESIASPRQHSVG